MLAPETVDFLQEASGTLLASRIAGKKPSGIEPPDESR